jgi:ABC-type antimicrobial peptide transport system permease subunit
MRLQKAWRTTKTAFRALRRNPMRALLTMLGIIIGVGAVIAMMEIGKGSSSDIEKAIAGMGANNLTISPGTSMANGVSYGTGSVVSLKPTDCDAILRECPAVKNACPLVWARPAQIVYQNRNWVPATMTGSSSRFLEVRDWELSDGSMFTERDVRNASRVCVVGQTIVREVFMGQSPVGKTMRLQNVSFKVIGTLNPKGANMYGTDQDDVLIAPWTTIRYRIGGSGMANSVQTAVSVTNTVNTLNQLYPSGGVALYPAMSGLQLADTPMMVRFANIHQILVCANCPQDIAPAIRQISDMLRARHHLRSNAASDFTIRDMTEITEKRKEAVDKMTNLLLAVALISLVVGGVGIMNIMLVSVTERTREIGLRMAVGARAKDILRQFLMEAFVLCLIGGMVGIILGHGGSYLVRVFLKWSTQTSPEAIVAAIVVSASVGIAFGFYPAWKASRLDPIEALRYE